MQKTSHGHLKSTLDKVQAAIKNKQTEKSDWLKKNIQSLFIKHLLIFFLTLMVPTVLMGGLATFLIQDYILNDIKKSNLNQVQKTQELVEMVIGGVESLSLYTAASAVELLEFQELLQKEYLDIEDSKKLSTFKTFIDSIALSNPYIESIYLYLNNDRDRFLSSTTGGLMESDDFYDMDWLINYKKSDPSDMFMTEKRSFNKYALPHFEIEVLTIYQKMFVNNPGDGVIVVNVFNNYLATQLNDNLSLPDQIMLIVDSDNDILVANQPAGYIEDHELQELLAHTSNYFSAELHGESWIVSKSQSDHYGWTYISLTPRSVLYEVPKYLSLVTVALSVLSLLIGVVLAYIFTRRNIGQLDNITQIIKSAEQGKLSTPLPAKNQDVYHYIIERVITSFIKNHFLNVQLSERKYRAKAMELWALQSQLNPHFLFNTLETIKWKSIRLTGAPNEVNQMVENLADTLRYALDTDQSFVTIEEELTQTMSYIAIQKIRYNDQFDLIIDCDEDLKQHNIIKLILQPLIENSLSHGITGNAGKMLIKVRMRLKDSMLHIALIDTGVGIPSEKLQELRMNLEENIDTNEHIGLMNTHKRLLLTYGEHSGLTIRSKLGMGTAIYFSIPIAETGE